MRDILKELGLSPLLIFLSLIVGFVAKELWSVIIGYRTKAAQETLSQILREIETQLREFYLPLKERFLVSKSLFDTSQGWRTNGAFDNSILNIVSKDKYALRKIAVGKLFLPFNKDVERILLDKLHFRSPDDHVNYERILQHLAIWRTMEESVQEGLIERYDMASSLSFPGDEVEKYIAFCESLIVKRDELRKKILAFRRLSRISLIGLDRRAKTKS